MGEPLWWFAGVLCFFHCSEFALAWTFSRHEVSWSSWLFSTHYCVAMGCAGVEHLLWRALWPSMQQSQAARAISTIGFAFVVLGELVRKAGYIAAGASFTHDIKWHRQQHTGRLVTHGVYRYVRHPGYLGWFVWSVATQVLLTNPLCTVLFVYVAWRFFANRIPYEEALLVQFFGGEYVRYREATPTWLPYID